MSSPTDSWFATELFKIKGREPIIDTGVLLGCPLWGEAFIETFSRYCIPTLLAPANLKALLALNARIVIFTPTEDFLSVFKKTGPLERAGLRVQLMALPRELVPDSDAKRKSPKEPVYRTLGAVQNLTLQMAAHAGQGYHFFVPDHTYSDRYFEAMAEQAGKGVDAIAHGAVSIDMEDAKAELETFRQGGALAIPARKLGDIGSRHLHQQMQASVMNAAEGVMPVSQTVIWRGRDALHFAGPIFNPVWLSPRLTRQAPVCYPTTLDAELPRLMPSGFDIPGPDAEMVFAELSDKKTKPPVSRTNRDIWQAVAWIQMNFDNSYLSVMRRRTLIPTEPNAEGLADDEIERQHAELCDSLPACKLQAFELYHGRQMRRLRPFTRDEETAL